MLELHQLRPTQVTPLDAWRRAQCLSSPLTRCVDGVERGDGGGGSDDAGLVVPPLRLSALQTLCARDNLAAFTAAVSSLRERCGASAAAQPLVEFAIETYRGVNSLW